MEDLNPKCIAQCQEFSVEALQTPQVWFWAILCLPYQSIK